MDKNLPVYLVFVSVTQFRRELYSVCSLLALLISFVPITPVMAALPNPEVITLQKSYFEHIKFTKIKENKYTFYDEFLRIDVDRSASFLLLPFVDVKKINKISFQWKSEGKPSKKNRQHELERSGDDAVFKLGILLITDDPPFNPLATRWMKRVDELLSHPSENMIYLVAAAEHKPGEQWQSPYNKRVTMIAVDSVEDKLGWNQAVYEFEQTYSVVALWLMSDGDNTRSRFTTYIKNILLE